MGWWAIVTDEKNKDSWEEEYKNSIADMLNATCDNEDIMVTLVDCHI